VCALATRACSFVIRPVGARSAQKQGSGGRCRLRRLDHRASRVGAGRQIDLGALRKATGVLTLVRSRCDPDFDCCNRDVAEKVLSPTRNDQSYRLVAVVGGRGCERPAGQLGQEGNWIRLWRGGGLGCLWPSTAPIRHAQRTLSSLFSSLPRLVAGSTDSERQFVTRAARTRSGHSTSEIATRTAGCDQLKAL
jgi:hypothetical protein